LDDRSLSPDRNPDVTANRNYWAGVALDRLERIGQLQAKLNAAVLALEQAEHDRDEARAEVTLLKSVVTEQDAVRVDTAAVLKAIEEKTELEPVDSATIDAWKAKFDRTPLMPLSEAELGCVDKSSVIPDADQPETVPKELEAESEKAREDQLWRDYWSAITETFRRISATAEIPDSEPEPAEAPPTANLLTVLDGRISALDRRVDVVREELLKLGDQAEVVVQLQAEVALIQAEVTTIRDEPEPPLPSPEQLQKVIHDQRVDLMTRRIDDVVQHVEEMAGQVARLGSRFNLLNQGASAPVRLTEPLPLPSNAGDYDPDPHILNARVNLLHEKLTAIELQVSAVLGKTKLASKAAFADYTHFQAQLDETRQQVQETAQTIAFYWGNPLGPAAMDTIREEVKVLAEAVDRDQKNSNLTLASLLKQLCDLTEQNDERAQEWLAVKQTIQRMHQRYDSLDPRIEEFRTLFFEQGVAFSRRQDALERRISRVAAKLPKAGPAPAAVPGPAKTNGKPVKAVSKSAPQTPAKAKPGKKATR
jgi:hypothetical protein